MHENTCVASRQSITRRKPEMTKGVVLELASCEEQRKTERKTSEKKVKLQATAKLYE